MSKSAQKVAKEPSEIEKDAKLFKILQGSFPLFKKTILPILLIILILSFIGALLTAFLLTDVYWQQNCISAAVTALSNKIAADSSYTLTSADRALQYESLALSFTGLIFKSAFEFFPLVGLLLLATGCLAHLYTDQKEGSSTWWQSIAVPFSNRKRGATAIFLLLFLMLLIPVGLILIGISRRESL